jgi:serine phosphatase RsbU (regulator of sigma subunit)/type II secretory pathway pseudopilin PulG
VKPSSRRWTLIALVGATLALLAALLDIPVLSVMGKVLLVGFTVVFLLWLLWKIYRALLYKVGRRLAFSYLLIGVLPIPLVLLLLGVVAYILAGFFLSHLYRDAVGELQRDLQAAARAQTQLLGQGGPLPSGGNSTIAFAWYAKDGHKIGGDPRLPARWPAWVGARPPAEDVRPDREAPQRFFAGPGGVPTLIAAAVGEKGGVLARFTRNLDREISRRGDLWVDTDRPDDPGLRIQIGAGDRSLRLRQIRREQHAGEAEKFFKRLSKGEKYWDDPLLWWAEVTGPLLDPATGRVLSDRLNATLNGTPRTILRHLFSSSGEVESGVWAALVIFAILLFDVYLIATIMAVFMIVSLSLAVNRLSRATAAVRAGDFAMRIPVRRRDQLGDLQRSFNEMSADLQSLVASAAQKEALENELAIARDLQKSLIPSNLPIREGVEFATLFEPSAAIGGDYFDVLRLSEDELAVIIADVSGHGLSSGLRMAMVKAALLILVEETNEPDEIFRRLDRVVRDGRAFVTATLGLINLGTGTLRLLNAGHPPTYVIRGGEAREILLPSSPLGGLGRSYGHETVALERGDVVVWLSDGLIEAANASGDPFGYDSVLQTLQGFPPGASAADVRNRLLAAVERHVGSQPPGDDRTLMVMRWRGRAPAPTS